MVTEDFMKILDAVVSNVAAVKLQDCGYVRLRNQQGVVRLVSQLIHLTHFNLSHHVTTRHKTSRPLGVFSAEGALPHATPEGE